MQQALRSAAVPDAGTAPDAVAIVRAVLSAPDDELDYARAKLAFDELIDPDIESNAAVKTIDRLSETARRLAGDGATETETLAALRRVIYESGPWNDHAPYRYDLDDPFGPNLCRSLLGPYLETKLGNCVSMPALFLIVGERLGLDFALAAAPGHYFVRFHDRVGRVFNLETTSGALPARLEWMRAEMPMSDLALRNGVYVRSLPKREAIALMATTICEHFLKCGRPEEVATIAEIVLARWPNSVPFLQQKSSALSHIIHRDFGKPYPSPMLIPPLMRPRCAWLERQSQAYYDRSIALGWQPHPDAITLGEYFFE